MSCTKFEKLQMYHEMNKEANHNLINGKYKIYLDSSKSNQNFYLRNTFIMLKSKTTVEKKIRKTV